jgi:hypothetical protein
VPSKTEYLLLGIAFPQVLAKYIQESEAGTHCKHHCSQDAEDGSDIMSVNPGHNSKPNTKRDKSF